MDSESEHHNSPPETRGFKSSLHALVTSRMALIRLELKQAFQERVRAVASILVAAMLVFFSWALLLVGLIAALAIASEWPWHLIALGFAALHLMGALILVVSATNSAKAPTFPNTRSEFKKDCEWLESLQNKPKSKS